MEEVDLEALLQETARALPTVHTQDIESSADGEEEEEEEEEEGENSGKVAVFSRSDHLVSLGFHDSLASTGGTSQQGRTGSEIEEREGERTSKGEGLNLGESKGEMQADAMSDLAAATSDGSAVGGGFDRAERNGNETGANGHEMETGDMEWRHFKSDFLEQLSSSEHEVRVQTAASTRQHLLMEAVAALQAPVEGEKTTQASQTGMTSQTSETSQAKVDHSSVSSQATATCSIKPPQSELGNKLEHSSPPEGQRSGASTILSTSTLAGIEMSELDKALEEIEVGGGQSQPLRGQSTGLPPPKLAWKAGDGEAAGDLMSQLVVMSRTQSQGLATGGGRGAGGGEGAGKIGGDGVMKRTSPAGKKSGEDEGGKGTVYLDLRLPSKQQDGGREATDREVQECSNSDSEKSDDQMSWLAEYHKMKSSLSTSQTTQSIDSKSCQSHEMAQSLTPAPSTHLVESPPRDSAQSQAGEAGAEEGEKKHREMSKSSRDGRVQRGRRHEKQAEVSEGQDKPLSGVQSLTTPKVEGLPTPSTSDPTHHLQSSSSTSSSIVEGNEQGHPHITKEKHLMKGQLGGKGRQHSSESLTLSSELSSPSDGEFSPTKPVRQVLRVGVADQDGDKSAKSAKGKKSNAKKHSKKKRKGKGKTEQSMVAEENGVDSSSPEMGRAQKGVQGEDGGRRKEGEKKAQGGRSGLRGRKEEGWSKGEPLKIQKAALKRIRYDSLTTSSDEERGAEPFHLSRVEELVEPPPEEEEEKRERKGLRGGEGEGESKERLRKKLEQIIISKKPPAMFETPATDPVFHQDASFSAVLPSSDPSFPTDALLLLPLSSTHGLVTLPPSHSHISPEAHLTFHNLLFTYLTVSAAQALQSGQPVRSGNRPIPGFSPARGSASRSKLHMRITALHQTTLDGQFVLLVGASLPQGRMRSVSYPRVLPSETRKSLKAYASGSTLSPLKPPPNPSARELESVLCGVKVGDLVGEVGEREGKETGEVKKEGREEKRAAILTSVWEEIQPLLELPAGAFFSVYSDPTPVTTPISFYWRSLYQPSCLPSSESLRSTTALQSTVCVLPPVSLLRPDVVFHTLHGAHSFGLYVAGVRLVFGEPSLPLDLPATTCNDDVITDSALVLALALRGPDAVYRCMDLAGPEDYNLAKVTDPCSIIARFGSPDSTPVYCVRTPFRATAALSKWFGGRGCLHTGSVLGMTDPRTRSERRKRQRVRFSESDLESEDNLPPPSPDISFPPLVPNRPLLSALPYGQILLVVSPLLPPSSYSSILSTCGRLGFDVLGVKRVRLNSKRATALDIPSTFVSHFTPSSVPPSPNLAEFDDTHPLATEYTANAPPLPSLLLVLGRENALVHSCALKVAITESLKSLLYLNPQLEEEVSGSHPTGALLHALPYTPERLKMVGSFTSVATTSSSSLPQLGSEWEREGERCGEEIAFLAVTQSSSLSRAVETLQSVFGVKGEQGLTEGGVKKETEDENEERESETLALGGFELLGMKFIPQLFRFHAKQLCPVPTSDHTHQKAIQLLSDAPALVMVFRGIACNRRLQALLRPRSLRFSSRQFPASLSLLLSDSLSQAFHYTTMFFTDKELFCDSFRWPLASVVPSLWARADVLHDLQHPPPQLYSVVVMRGEGWRVLVKVVERLCRVGFSVCGMTMRAGEEKEEEEESVLHSVSAHQVQRSHVAVCVARQNAVWYLNHELRPFLPSTGKLTTVQFSAPSTFRAAVSLVHQYFPRGVCGPSGVMATDYGIHSQVMDDFSGLNSGLSIPPYSTISPSPLTEGTCIILPPSHLTPQTQHTPPLFLQLLELLAQANFSITGVQMTHLSEHTAASLHCVAGVSVKEFTGGPCLILLLQRDNAASCFQYILKSTAQYSARGEDTDTERLVLGAIIPDSPKMAKAVFSALQKEE